MAERFSERSEAEARTSLLGIPPRRTVRLALLGFGTVGQGVMRLAAANAWLDIVGVIVRRAELDGRAATEVVAEAPPELRLSTDGATLLAATRPDVVLVATRSTLPEILPHLRVATSSGAAVACTAEDLGYIERGDGPEAAAILDLAEERHVAIVQVALNPGFLLDVWPLVLASIATEIEALEALRMVDVSAYGPQVRATLGIGLSPADFERALSDGTTAGHRGFRESLRLIGRTLGRPLDDVEVKTTAILAQRDRPLPGGVLRRGQTAGVSQVATGRSGGVPWLRVDMTASVALDELEVDPIDRVHLIGRPELTVTISPNAPSLAGTLGRIVNALPAVAAAPVGVHSALALGITPWTAPDGR